MNAINQIYQFSMLNIYLYILSVKVGRNYICAILEFRQNYPLALQKSLLTH